MITGFFLIPTRYTGKGELPLDYRVERRKMDRRTRFYRNFIKWEVNEAFAVGAAQRIGLRIFYDDGEVVRILAQNSKSARAFFEHLQGVNFGNSRKGV